MCTHTSYIPDAHFVHCLAGMGHVIASASADSSVKIWDCDAMACTHTLSGKHNKKEVIGASLCPAAVSGFLSLAHTQSLNHTPWK